MNISINIFSDILHIISSVMLKNADRIKIVYPHMRIFVCRYFGINQ